MFRHFEINNKDETEIIDVQNKEKKNQFYWLCQDTKLLETYVWVLMD